ncbi:MAG: TrkH family potassium uptake protein, partial [Bacillota bacterium]
MNLRLKLRDNPLSPPQILAIGFIIIITLGTLFLKLPVSRTMPLSWLDAFFTATSAVTVTGLIVVDTGTAFTTFGQTVLMILIQIGGLGFLTFAVMSILFLGKKIRLKERLLMQEALNQNSMGGIIRLIRTLFYFAVTMELIATALLSIRWIPEFGVGRGLFVSLFHAISSFNNAGFSLFSDSLSQYVADPLINIVITLLFVSGGIGFTVIYELMHKRKWRTWTLHTKVMLIGTFLINVFAVLSFFILEMNNPNTIGSMPLDDQLWGSFFQGLTPRTAGFNSLDYGQMNQSTLMLTIFLMFIGAGSASTASGIKVTTLIIIILAVIAYLRGHSQVFAFRQRIDTEVVIRSLSIIVISFFIVFMAIFVLAVTEDLPMMSV